MKKTRFIAVILIVAVVLMGAGYAYWTQELNITGTVNTGELTVEFRPPAILESGDYDRELTWRDLEGLWRNGLGNYDGAPYMDVEVIPSEDNQKLTFNVTDIYPGSGAFLNFIIRNTGTVPAEIREIDYENLEDDANLKDVFNYRIARLYIYRDSRLFPIVTEGNPIVATTFEEFIDGLNERLQGHILEPDDGFVINFWNRDLEDRVGTGYNIEMPSGVTDNDLQGKEFSFDLILDFVQATE